MTKAYSQKTQGKRRRRLLGSSSALMALEPRVLFDGAIAATADSITEVTSANIASAQSAAHVGDSSGSKPAVADVSTAASNTQVREVERNSASSQPASAAAIAANEIVFVDTSAPDWQVLVQNARTGTHVYVLDASRDGIEQIGEILADTSGVSTIHLVSHGADGMLMLGSTRVDSAVLSQRAAEVAG